MHTEKLNYQKANAKIAGIWSTRILKAGNQPKGEEQETGNTWFTFRDVFRALMLVAC